MNQFMSRRSAAAAVLGAALLIALAPPAALPTSARASCVDAAPGSIQTTALFADSGPLFLQPQEPDPVRPVTLTLRAAACDLTAAKLTYHLTATAPLLSVPMHLAGRDATGRYDLWKATIEAGAAGTELSYRFLVFDGKAMQYYGANGFSATTFGAGKFAIAPGFHTPAWARNAIFYQIFPDRFKNGNPKNDVRTGEYSYQGKPVLAQPWSALPENPGLARDFFGGDLAGIEQELNPYLKQTLGVTALYLNPIFQSLSNHKYDTQNYYLVDPHFGSNADLQTLIAGAHGTSAYKGDYRLSVVLDGVFNHTGDSIAWFNKERLYPPNGAYNTKKSPYYSFYTFTSWPNVYADFNGCCPTLPTLNYSTPGVRDAIYRSPDSVMQHYLKPPYGIDGWRLDAADQLSGSTGVDSHQVWSDARPYVKRANAQALLIGETWNSASDWLDGTQWDGAMNYFGFATPVSQWITGYNVQGALPSSIGASGLNYTLSTYAAALPRPAQLVMLNSLSTQDVPRFLYRAKGNAGEMNIAQILQMTALGMPCIYYGDEIGMTGATDPDDRRPFDWNQAHWNRTILNMTEKLVALRKATPALVQGSFLGLLTDDVHNGYVFGRWLQGQRAVVALNDDAKAHSYSFDVSGVEALAGSVWQDALRGGSVRTSSSDTVTLTLPPYTGTVLVQRDSQ